MLCVLGHHTHQEVSRADKQVRVVVHKAVHEAAKAPGLAVAVGLGGVAGVDDGGVLASKVREDDSVTVRALEVCPRLRMAPRCQQRNPCVVVCMVCPHRAQQAGR